MEAIKSDFILKDFVIVASLLKEISNVKQSQKINLIDLPIDIKLYLLKKSSTNKIIRIFMNISINKNDKPISGYSISVLGYGDFIFSKNMEKKKKDKIVFFSGVPMLLNFLRGYISDITSYGKYGKYLLPSIDINDLEKKFIEFQDSYIAKKK